MMEYDCPISDWTHGSKAIDHERVNKRDGTQEYSVGCENCLICTEWHPTYQEAVDEWEFLSKSPMTVAEYVEKANRGGRRG